MEKAVCIVCQKSKAPYTCGICEGALCKSHTQFLDEDSFSFLPQVPSELKHTTYCESCFEQKVTPALQSYQDAMDRAKDVHVFMKNQGKETRLLKRTEDPVQVTDCPDREETLLRLAFFAALAGYNGLIDVDLQSEKVKTGSYQTSKWSGSGIPTHLNADKLVKDRSIWQNPN